MSDHFANLSSSPYTVMNLLGDKNRRYLIPDYQREYRWREDEHCETLWNDLTEQFQQFLDNSEGRYYLGSIIAHRNEKRLCVIDGQQRLITLSLFLRQLFGKIYGQKLSQRDESIYFCDNQKTVDADGNPSWSIPKESEHRIISEVLGKEENFKLRDALSVISDTVSESNKSKDNRYATNSVFFNKKVEEFYNETGKDDGLDAGRKKLLAFVDFVLNHVYLLLIETANFEDALTILTPSTTVVCSWRTAILSKPLYSSRRGTKVRNLVNSGTKYGMSCIMVALTMMTKIPLKVKSQNFFYRRKTSNFQQ